MPEHVFRLACNFEYSVVINTVFSNSFPVKELPYEPEDGTGVAPPVYKPSDCTGLTDYDSDGYQGVGFQRGQCLPPPPLPPTDPYGDKSDDLMQFGR